MNNLIKIGDTLQKGRFVIDYIVDTGGKLVSSKLIANDRTLNKK
jgi:hypothetical protein